MLISEAEKRGEGNGIVVSAVSHSLACHDIPWCCATVGVRGGKSGVEPRGRMEGGKGGERSTPPPPTLDLSSSCPPPSFLATNGVCAAAVAELPPQYPPYPVLLGLQRQGGEGAHATGEGSMDLTQLQESIHGNALLCLL